MVQNVKAFHLEIPTIQNWSCHGCTDCCRYPFLINISGAEKERIERQNWTKADGVDPAAIIVSDRGSFRLGHQSDGACVFLDPAGRCRIHAKFGESAKPLACRLYPLVLHPAGSKLVVGLRFSCPSVAANRGDPLAARAAEIKQRAGEVVPEGFEREAPPAVAVTPGSEWPDFLRFVKWLDTSMAEENVPVGLKLLRALHWLDAVERGRLDQITGAGADEILAVLVRSAAQKVPALPEPPAAPSRFGRVFFRLMVVEHARAVTMAETRDAGRYRWIMLAAILRFLPQNGHTPALGARLKSVRFAEVERPFGPLSPAVEETLTRFFRVKIQSLHFCGRAFHDAPLIEGFRSLALLYPIVVWLARWQAAGEGRDRISDEEVTRAITMADYHHGYSPWLRGRVRLLAERKDIARLCGWYSR